MNKLPRLLEHRPHKDKPDWMIAYFAPMHRLGESYREEIAMRFTEQEHDRQRMANQIHADEQVIAALMQDLEHVAALADTGSRQHREAFDPDGAGAVPPGWRVAEKMREAALDAVGRIPARYFR